MTFSPVSSLSPFIGTFQEFPVQKSDEMKRVLTKMYTDFSHAINIRESGEYDLVELMTGQRFWGINNQTKRFVFRKVFSFGAVASGAALVIPHNITPLTFPTNIYGVILTDVPDWRPVPYAGTGGVGDMFAVKVDPINITVASGVGFPNVTNGIIVIEYLKT